MKTTNATTINHSFKRDDVIDFHSFGAASIEGEQILLADRRRSAVFNILPAVIESSGVVGISSPTMPALFIDGFVKPVVTRFLECRDFLAVRRIGLISSLAPVILVGAIFSEVARRSLVQVLKRAWFAFVANSRAFFVVVAAGFLNTAAWADLGFEGRFHSDIVATNGDVKLDELGENREPATPSQAAQGCAEGVTTRGIPLEQRCSLQEPPGALAGIRHSLSYTGTYRSAGKELRDNKLTTIQSRSEELADNVTNNNALLRRLKAKGNVRTVSGGNLIFEEIMYTDSSTINVNSYSGYEVLNISPNSPISAAQFSFTQYAGAISISGLEILQNSGKEALIDLLEGRQKIAEAQLQNRIDYDCYQDGTGNAAKNIVGLAAAVPDDPTTGTYGGISRSSYSFWRSQLYDASSDGGAATSATNIQTYMTALALECVRGSNKPDLWVMDGNYYGFYVNSLQAIQRITSSTGSGTAGAGFGPELKFYGGGMSSDVVLGSGISGAVSSTQSTSGATANHAWALNTDYIFWRPHKDRNFVPIGGERQSVNQDAVVKLIGWAGNMTSSGPQFSGVLIA